MTIPNIFHFINIGPRQLTYIHFLSIYSAYSLNNPEKIYLYCDHDQKDNFYWEILKDIVTVVKIETPKYFGGITLKSYQYKADIIRMQKLIEYGGIYMDLDVLSLKPLTCFLDKNIVMGVENSKNNNITDIKDVTSLTNAIILSEPNNIFLKYWLSRMNECINEDEWAYHAVKLPQIILEYHDFDVHIEPKKSFMPFCFRQPYIFYSEKNDMITNLDNSYTIHLWETIWNKNYLQNIDVEYFMRNENIFTKLFDKYNLVLYKNIDKLEIMIKKYGQQVNFEKLCECVMIYSYLTKKYQKLKK